MTGLPEGKEYGWLTIERSMKEAPCAFCVYDERGNLVAMFNRLIDAERFVHIVPALRDSRAMPERLRPAGDCYYPAPIYRKSSANPLVRMTRTLLGLP